MTISKNIAAVFGILCIMVGVGASVSAAPTGDRPEEFRAFFMTSDIDTLRTVSSLAIIHINHWTSDTEHAALVAAFNSGGQEAFLKTLGDLPKVGYFRMPDSIGYDLHYAMQQPTAEGGRRLFLATDRPIVFAEQFDRARSADYPFTVIELRLGKDDKGDGTIAQAAKIIVSLDGKYFDVENFGPFPAILRSVKKTK